MIFFLSRENAIKRSRSLAIISRSLVGFFLSRYKAILSRGNAILSRGNAKSLRNKVQYTAVLPLLNLC